MTTALAVDEQLVDEQLVELATDPAADYATDEFSAPIGADSDVSRETSEINTAPAPRRKPGPKPDPNSARSRRRAAKSAAAPRKRTRPNTSSTATAAEPDNVYERGALAILGLPARLAAMAGLGLGMTAATMPTHPETGEPTAKARRIGQHGQALTLDALTLTVHGPELAKGAAPLAAQIPWMAAVLEKAAAVSPAAALFEAAAGIALQILANHGILPVSPLLGTMSPDELRAFAGFATPSE